MDWSVIIKLVETIFKGITRIIRALKDKRAARKQRRKQGTNDINKKDKKIN